MMILMMVISMITMMLMIYGDSNENLDLKVYAELTITCLEEGKFWIITGSLASLHCHHPCHHYHRHYHQVITRLEGGKVWLSQVALHPCIVITLVIIVIIIKSSFVLAGRSVKFEYSIFFIYLAYFVYFAQKDKHLLGGGSEGHDLRRLKEVARFYFIRSRMYRMILLKRS